MSEFYYSEAGDDMNFVSPLSLTQDNNILDINMFVTQPFSTYFKDTSKPMYVYYGYAYEMLRLYESGNKHILWIRADKQDAFEDCLERSKYHTCIVDPSFPTFRSLLIMKRSG